MTSFAVPAACEEASAQPVSATLAASKPVDLYQWHSTWQDFKIALFAPADQEFNGMYWLLQFAGVALHDISVATGTRPLLRWLHAYGNHLCRPALPLLGFFLIVSIVSSYFFSLRSGVVYPQTCPCASMHINNTIADDQDCPPAALASCQQTMLLHDLAVMYLSVMILFYYLETMCRSPGYNESQDVMELPPGDRGIFGWFQVRDLKPNITAEREQAPLFSLQPVCQTISTNNPHPPDLATDTARDLAPGPTSRTPALRYFPGTDPTFCITCKTWRPPRCHHCRVCRRCVLEFDHHCIWFNNCIGYNNHRSFVCFLIYLSIGSVYGTALLCRPFYQNLKQQIVKEGWQFWKYSHGTGLLNLPPPWLLIRMLWKDRGLPADLVLNVVYPILVGIGLLMIVFGIQHLYFASIALTTLEYNVLNDPWNDSWLQQNIRQVSQLLNQLFHKGNSTTDERSPVRSTPQLMAQQSRDEKALNPYDKGSWHKNLAQLFGRPLWLILLPIPVRPLPQYLPAQLDSKKET